MVKVSVLLPVYNTKEEFLRAAVDSILNQTFKDFELLILNDASTDENVEKVIKSYKDKRIRYAVNKTNLGISETRNKLIEMAKGTYLAIMDHDDVSLPTRLEKQAKYLDEHKNVGVVGSKICKLNGNKVSANPTESHDIKLALMRVCAITHPAAMIRKSVLTDNKIRYEERFSPAEDYALWCRLIPRTDFYNIPEVLFSYREHKTNTSKLQNDKMHNATLAIWAFAKVENPEIYEEFLLKAEHKNYIRLFGFIPFLCIEKNANRTKVCLFEKIPLLTSKNIIKLRGDAKNARGRVNALPTFDFVFSLGAACLSTQSLRKADLQFASYPFDWLAGGNICKRAEIISSDFSSFMQKKNLKDLKIDNKARTHLCEVYEDTKNGIILNHDFEYGKTLDETFDDVRKKYDRRIERLMTNIKSSKNILACYIEISDENGIKNSDEDIIKAQKTLAEKFPNQNIYLLYLQYCPTGYTETKLSDKVIKISFDYKKHKNAKTNSDADTNKIAKILKKIKIKQPFSDVLKRNLLSFCIKVIPFHQLRKKAKRRYHIN